MPRSIAPVPAGWPAEDRLRRFDFLLIYFTTGREAWTNRPGESYIKDIGNGEGELTWDGTHVWEPGQFEQADQDPLSVSDLTFGNADLTFTDKMRLQGAFGLRGTRIDAWIGAFNKDDFEEFYGSIPIWSGVMSRVEAVGSDVRVSLRPFSDPLSIKFPRRRWTLSHGFKWIPPVGLKIYFGQTVITPPNPQKPAAPGSEGGGGGGFVPPPGGGWTGPVARNPPRRGPKRGGPPTAHGGTRTVKR